MKKVTEIIKELSSTKSRNDKKAILAKYGDCTDLKDVLRFVFNPYVRTGIACTKLNKGKHTNTLESLNGSGSPMTWQHVVDYFMDHNTGTAADVEMAWNFINGADDDDTKKLIKAVVTKHLKIGVTDKTLNEVYGNTFIPRVGVMLAHPYEDKKDSVEGPFIVTEKLDGIRRVLIKHNGKIEMFSRSGQPDDGLVDILKDAEKLPDECVYDGELLAEGTYTDCIAQRQATNSIANSKGNRTGLTFNVFDMIPYDDFVADCCDVKAIIRKIGLAVTLDDTASAAVVSGYSKSLAAYTELTQTVFDTVKLCHIKSVPIIGIVDNDEDAIKKLAEPIWQRGGEGVMLNTLEGLYRIKRSKDILKVKHVESYDLPIVGFEEGTGKYAGMLGALYVDYNGTSVGVGSGLDDALRKQIWENQSDYLGKTVEIDTFGSSKNKDGGISLNCPIFKGIRYDK